MEKIFFFKNPNYAVFSNFYPSLLTLDGKEWPTVEHYFQAMKTLDPFSQDLVRVASGPGPAKRLGRRVPLRPDWEQIKVDVMAKAIRAKFSSEPFRSVLLRTDEAEIYEDSPTDCIWGTGEINGVGTGQNLLGKILMQIRHEMQWGLAT